MRIVQLSAENVKRLKAVEITPDGNLVVISGRNAQGKSSVLDAIWLALAGGDAAKATPRPIRDGEDHASVTLNLGDLTVTREWRSDRPTKLTVKMADGRVPTSPQKMLDELVGKLSFDPLAFTRLSPREQRQQLLDLIGLDFRQADIDRQRLYDERLSIGRDRDSYGDLGDVSTWDSVPEAEMSSRDIIEDIKAAQDVETANARLYDAVSRASQGVAYAEMRVSQAEEDVSSAARALATAEANLATRKRELDDAVDSARKATDSAASGVAPVDIQALQARLDEVEEINTRVRKRQEWTRAKAAQDMLADDYRAKTEAIEAIDEAKREALKKAKMPVPGLGFTDQGVTYQGVPFEQSSSAEQIKVSLGMAMAANPTLRVIRIMDGSLLDADSMQSIAEMAETSEMQIWVERVEDNSESAIVIEDGSVVS